MSCVPTTLVQPKNIKITVWSFSRLISHMSLPKQEGVVPIAQRATMVMKPNLLLAWEIIKDFKKRLNAIYDESSQWKMLLPLAGIEPGTFGTIVQHLSHWATKEKQIRKFWLIISPTLLAILLKTASEAADDLRGQFGPRKSIQWPSLQLFPCP